MSDRPPIPDLLDRAALALMSLADAPAPINVLGGCYLCCLTGDHDPDCGWVIGRRTASSDIDALQRLARALRYGPS
jgi:hypothetical protein